MIEIKNLSVTYPGGNHALENVSLTINPGEITGLVGPNGAGKSTLFKSVMGFVTPETGDVSIEGQGVRVALKQNRIAYVPQTEDVDWDFPVLANDVVMMGRYGRMGFLRIPSKADKKAVENALERVGMNEFASRQIGELSGGQKKRIFVARALAQESQVILLDEPFTGVDIKTEAMLTSLFKELAKEGRLILVSTHNLGSVPHFCDSVVLVAKTVLASGPVETTFTHENLGKAFGGMLRDIHLMGADLHDDEDERSVTVLTDDERPLVIYGDSKDKKIVHAKDKGKKK